MAAGSSNCDFEVKLGDSEDEPNLVRVRDPMTGIWSGWIEQDDYVKRVRDKPGSKERMKALNDAVRAAKEERDSKPTLAPTDEGLTLEEKVERLREYLNAHPKTRLMDLELHIDAERGPLYILAKKLLERGDLVEHPRTMALSFRSQQVPAAKEELESTGEISVRVLRDLPPIRDSEGKDRRLIKGELVRLPDSTARALIKKGVAEELPDIAPTPENVPTATPDASAGGEGPLQGRTAAPADMPPTIPPQLRDIRFRFVLVKKRGKNPIEQGWQHDANYPYDHERLAAHLADEGNYGVLCGDGLAVVDADAAEVQEAVRAHLPPTFTVRTGRESGEGRHFYFRCEDLLGPIRLARPGDVKGTIGDVQHIGKQVIGPGSVHPSGNRYEVLEDLPIATISAEQLRYALRDYLPPVEMDTPEDIKREMPHGDSELAQLHVEKVIPLDGLTRHGNKYQGPCPWHGSDGGQNFTIDLDKNVWHCFRHESGGGPLQAIAVMENIISCEESRRGKLRGDAFREALVFAEKKYGLIRTPWPGPGAAALNDRTKDDPASKSLIKLVEETGLEVFVDQFREPYAAIERDGHREIMAIASTEFELWVRYLHYKRSGGEGLGDEPLKRAISTLKARAVFEGQRKDLSLRVAWHDDELWYDLGRDDWSAVRISSTITPHGWEVVARPPIIFKRAAHMLPQDLPVPGGDWAELWNLLNLPMREYGALCRSHILHMFIPGHPRPWLNLYNRRGAAKTIGSELLRQLVDPSSSSKQELQDRDRNFNNIFDLNYLPVFDNLAKIPESLLSKWCRVVTGEASSERLLGRNREQVMYQYQRTGIITSVSPINLDDPEAVARLIYLEAPYIPRTKRMKEEEVFERFYTARPRILGSIFSAIAQAIAIYDDLELDDLERFADYEVWGEALSRALGEEEGEFVRQYEANIAQAVSATLDANPLAQAILQYFEKDGRKEYIGTADPLYLELEVLAHEKNIDTKSKDVQKNWPGAANALVRKMPDIIDDLKQFGIHYARVEYKGLSQRCKDHIGERLAANRSIIMLVKKDSEFFEELPTERYNEEKKRYCENIVTTSQQTKKGPKNDITIISPSRSGEGRIAGA